MAKWKCKKCNVKHHTSKKETNCTRHDCILLDHPVKSYAELDFSKFPEVEMDIIEDINVKPKVYNIGWPPQTYDQYDLNHLSPDVFD